jgi:hypothetical protein
MPVPDIDDQIDRLYQLPLGDFTAARNALAKEAKRPDIRDVEKPNIAAWAVNQLYWHHRADYDRLVKAAERLRGEHRKLLAGKASDIREPEKLHRDAIRAASDRIRAVLEQAGHPASDQTMTAVQETLEALPAAEHVGRLTRPLKPLGFEALAGMSISPSTRPALRVVPRASPRDDEAKPRDARGERERAKQREKEDREKKERQREAERELKAAEAAMLRAEDAVKKAEKTLSDLRADRDRAVSEYQRARLRARE